VRVKKEDFSIDGNYTRRSFKERTKCFPKDTELAESKMKVKNLG